MRFGSVRRLGRAPFLGLVAACTAIGIAGLMLAWPVLRPRPVIAATTSLGPVACQAGSRPGVAGRDDDLRTPQDLPISVRTPLNYDPVRAQPLLVIYPPAGFGRSASEHFYGLTEEATRRGWIVAYPTAVPLSQRALTLAQSVAGTVARRWCVDTDRVAFLGHSDGATVAEGLLLRALDLAPYPSHVLASAAGLRGSDFKTETCPRPLDLTLIHSTGDQHFPGYGHQAAQWWAACYSCTQPVPPAEQIAPGQCVELGPCAQGARVRYCQPDDDHATWPHVAADPFKFIGTPTPPMTTTASTPLRRL